MLNETEKEKLRFFVIEQLRENADLFDIEAEMDSSLSYNENKNLIAEKLELFVEKQVTGAMAREIEIQRKLGMNMRKSPYFLDKIDESIKVMVVYGETGSGKTAFCFKMLQEFKKEVWVFNHPNKDLISAIGYNNMHSLGQMARIQDCVVYFDEPQLSIGSRYDKKSNELFLMLCSLARQRNLTLIFSTSDTRWINKGLESYVTHWIVKDIDISLVKNGSAVKTIIKNVMPESMGDLNLSVDEFIFYSRQNAEFNGIHKFVKPIYFDDRFSKPYKIATKNSENAGKIANLIEEKEKSANDDKNEG